MKANAYCALCRNERRIFRKRRLGAWDIVVNAFASFLLMMLIWQAFDARVFVFFVLGLALSEGVIQIRWRLSVVCPHCGFDPALYVQNNNAAALKVKSHLEARKSDSKYIFAKPVNLPKLTKKTSTKIGEEESTRGRILSRQV